MSILKSREIRKMTEEEISKKMDELRLDLAKKKAQIFIGGAPENAGRIKEVKRTIARILTIRNEKKNKTREVIKNQ